MRIDLGRARAHWRRKQGLDGSVRGSIAEVIERTGWVRTLAGVDVYLATRARVPAMKRVELEGAVLRQELQVIMAVRSCIYMVPRAHVPLALRFAAGMWRKRTERDLVRVGAAWPEVDEVAAAVRTTLAARGALGTDALRRAMPPGSVRSLGEVGKKVGLSSLLPVAVRELELRGEIERALPGGRLDTSDYLWRVPAESPFARAPVPDDPIALAGEVIAIYVRQMGPIAVDDVAEWAGIAQRDVRAAIAGRPIAAIDVEGYADGALVDEDDVRALERAARDEDAIAFLSFEDNYVVAHGGAAVLVDPSHHARSVRSWGQKAPTTLGEVRHLAARAVVVGDRIAGFWEHDPDSSTVVIAPLGTWSAAVRARVEARGHDVARFLGEEMGHARSFSLDTDAAVRERAAELRRMGAAVKGAVKRAGGPKEPRGRPAAAKAKTEATDKDKGRPAPARNR